MSKNQIHIGTSGWHYNHWKGTFYPPDTKDSQQFALYTKQFKTVELNNSFYHLPSAETFAGWRMQSPPDFLFSVKASRYITHMKKLIVDRSAIDLFFANAGKLEEKLGPVLFQLPPQWKINTERLSLFLQALSIGFQYTFEFRNQTWYTEEVYDILNKYNCAFCVYELERHTSPQQVTADFVYIRLHGPGDKYQGSYSNDALKYWSDCILQWKKQGKNVYVYFDNDQEGYAAFNALTLADIVTADSA